MNLLIRWLRTTLATLVLFVLVFLGFLGLCVFTPLGLHLALSISNSFTEQPVVTATGLRGSFATGATAQRITLGSTVLLEDTALSFSSFDLASGHVSVRIATAQLVSPFNLSIADYSNQPSLQASNLNLVIPLSLQGSAMLNVGPYSMPFQIENSAPNLEQKSKNISILNYYWDDSQTINLVFEGSLQHETLKTPPLQFNAQSLASPERRITQFDFTQHNTHGSAIFELNNNTNTYTLNYTHPESHTNLEIKAHQHTQGWNIPTLSLTTQSLVLGSSRAENLKLNGVLRQNAKNWDGLLHLSATQWTHKNLSLNDFSLDLTLSPRTDKNESGYHLVAKAAPNALPYIITLDSSGTKTSQQSNLTGTPLTPKRTVQNVSSVKKESQSQSLASSPLAPFTIKTAHQFSWNNQEAVLLLSHTTLNNDTALLANQHTPKRITISPRGIYTELQPESEPALCDFSLNYQDAQHWQGTLLLNQLDIAPLFQLGFAYSPALTWDQSVVKARLNATQHSASDQPDIRGDLQILSLEARLHLNELLPSYVPKINPLPIQNKNLKGSFSHNTLTIDGQVITVNDTPAQVIFKLPFLTDTPATQSPAFFLSLQGSALPLIAQENTQITSDSDLQIQSDGKKMNINGTFTLHNSYYHHSTPWNATPALPRETVICKKQNTPALPPLQKAYDITLHVPKGNSASLYGIHGNVHGTVRLKSASTTQDPLVFGHMDVESANVHFFGERIPLENMRFDWNSATVDNPECFIEISQHMSLPGNNHKQYFGVRITGLMQTPNIDFFSSPRKMTQYEILASLISNSQKLTQSVQSGSQDIQKLFDILGTNTLNTKDIADSLRTLSTIKRFFVFEYVDIAQNQSTSEAPESGGAFFRDLEFSLTRKIRENLTLQLKLNPDNPDATKLLLDTQLNKNLSVGAYIDSKGSGGVACHYRR